LRNFDLQLHQNAFGGRAPPGPTEGAYRAPGPPSWILGVWAGKDRKGRDGRRGRGERRVEERKGGKGEGKGRGSGRDHPNKKAAYGPGGGGYYTVP